jgi:hypothetical protein
MIRKCSLTRAIRLVVATSSEKVKFIFYKCVNVKYSMTVEADAIYSEHPFFHYHTLW